MKDFEKTIELAKLEYEAAKLEAGRKMAESGVEKAEIFKKLILNERDLLNQAKVESWPPKEKNLFRKGMEWWMKQGAIKRLLYSTVFLGGLAVGASFAGIPGAAVAATALFNPSRFIRIGGGLAAGHLVRAMGGRIERWRGKIDQARVETALSRLKEGLTPENLKTIEGEFEKILEEQEKRARKRRLYIGIASAVAGVGGSIGAGMLEHAWAGGGVRVVPETLKPRASAPETPAPPETPSEIPTKSGIPISPEEIKPKISIEAAAEAKPKNLPIGERGPEGAIIDYFRDNPDIAVEKFGCPADLVKEDIIQDLDNFNEWVGAKAHLMWLEDAKEALVKPETLKQLQKLGYSPNAEGYAQMMHRIGKGGIEFDFETGKINLVDAEYLKARVPSEAMTHMEKVAQGKPLTPEEIVLAEERISNPIAEIPGVKSTEQIFSEVSPAMGRQILTEKLHDYFGMWSGTYDKFSDLKLRDFFVLDNASGYRITGAPWENYDYNKFSGLQNKMEKVYNALDSTEKSGIAGKSVETFIKKYFVKIFS